MKEVFNELPILAYRRDKNLCDIERRQGWSVRVQMKVNVAVRCVKHCMRVKSLMWRGTKRINPLSKPACTLRNVVYALLCEPCRKTVYVGETKRSAKERIGEHLRDVKNQTEKPIMRHFSGHTVDVRFVVLQCLGWEGRAYRQLVEEKWIVRLGTKIPSGYNVQLSF